MNLSPATQAMLNSLGLLVIGSVLTFLAARYWFRRNQDVVTARELRDEAIAEAARIKEDHDKLMGRVQELEMQHALVKASVVPITTAFQALLIKNLTHFHTPVMDALMVKVGPPNTLTTEESEQLARLLEEREADMDGEIPESERIAARILPGVMTLAKMEQEAIDAESVLAVVAVPTGKHDDSLPTPPEGPK